MAHTAQHKTCRESASERWGISGLDGAGGGLIRNTFNMVSMPDHESAYAVVAHFLAEGLSKGARTALAAIDNPALIFAELGRFGFDFDSALERERLVYLYYKPAFLHSLGLCADYTRVFAEIRRLSGDIRRLVLLNAELMFNLQSQHLAAASVSNAVAAAGRLDFTVLGCFVPQHTDAYRFLDASCAGLMPLYIHGARKPRAPRRRYRLEARRRVGVQQRTVVLDLDAGNEPIRVSSCAEIA